MFVLAKRCRGHGGHLLDALEQAAVARGVQELVATAKPDSELSAGLVSAGFEPFQVLLRKRLG